MSDHPDPIEELPSVMLHPISGVPCYFVPQEKYHAQRAAYDAKCSEVEKAKKDSEIVILAREGQIYDLEQINKDISAALDTANAQNVVLREALEGWRKYWQSDIPTNKEQHEQAGEEFTDAWFAMEKALSTTSDNPVEKRLREAEAALKRCKCVYCGLETPFEEKEALADHITSCEKSPMVQMVKQMELIVADAILKIDAEILEVEGAEIYAKNAGEWRRLNVLEGNKVGLLFSKRLLTPPTNEPIGEVT